MIFELAIASYNVDEHRVVCSRPVANDKAASLETDSRPPLRILIMEIRQEQQGDHPSIANVTERAFAGAEYSDQTEHEIIERLRATNALAISLVAVENDALVGHIAFSPVTIDGVHRGWFGLGPVSVEPHHQVRGIGSALIRTGLEQLRSRGAAGCVVLGRPAYYRRFGFERDGNLRYEGAPPEYFMRVSFTADKPPSGRVDYAAAFAG